ncbi:uncharacterized protein LOC131679379 [Topomyia yanbarensis]|uniref:uncharacterized protein LOC131679379 n=1 Tax=Topomyia yanbarensis TaxID=2498891 RepID=UPI00273BECAE|nr:uncharacterized protein LOC131679379 [Topomyia yanbarensis]
MTFTSRSWEYQNVILCVVLNHVRATNRHTADGNELFFNLLEPGTIKILLQNRLPVLQNTKLGWVVSGGYECPKQSEESSLPLYLLASCDDLLSKQLQQFWELQVYANTKPYFSNQETQCEDHFLKYTIRNEFGHFVARLPFQKNPTILGDSREIELLHLERKVDKNPQLLEQNHAFLREYVELGHMLLAASSVARRPIFLPHHCIVKEASTTTKSRVVLGAFAKTTRRKHFNDLLMAGPVL